MDPTGLAIRDEMQYRVLPGYLVGEDLLMTGKDSASLVRCYIFYLLLFCKWFLFCSFL